MRRSFKILFLFIFGYITAQKKSVEKVYFDFDKFSLPSIQKKNIIDFIKNVDTTIIESAQIYGYCDDRGANDYNYKLSVNRANKVKKTLTDFGFNKNKIVIIEGRGRITLNKDTIENLVETRSKNRRVDLILVKKINYGKGIYTSIQKTNVVGDRIYLEDLLFDLGSSKLRKQAKEELDKIIIDLKKFQYIKFQVTGHVCCTPNYYEDAIDRETKQRNLSINRARTVFRYLLSRNIDGSRMTYKGCGNKFPLGKGEALDRRVELVITKI